MSGNEGLFILTRYLEDARDSFCHFIVLCWPMRCEESCFCAMLIFLLMNRYETSSIASEISFKHFNCYRLSVQDKPSLWETSHDSNLNLCPTRLATEYLYLLLTHKRFGIRLTF